jgi:mRNA-degrading endonuclease HigB of HigAB toxin-antitoxin module
MLELMEKYPHAAKEVVAFYLEKLLDSLKTESVPEDFKEYVRQQGVDNNTIIKIVENSPRMLFDVFDVYEIYIEICIKNGEFGYNIYIGEGESLEVKYYKSRKEAEEVAVQHAFKLLNDKLCEQIQ